MKQSKKQGLAIPEPANAGAAKIQNPEQFRAHHFENPAILLPLPTDYPPLALPYPLLAFPYSPLAPEDQ
jgi:hypothetical protein